MNKQICFEVAKYIVQLLEFAEHYNLLSHLSWNSDYAMECKPWRRNLTPEKSKTFTFLEN